MNQRKRWRALFLSAVLLCCVFPVEGNASTKREERHTMQNTQSSPQISRDGVINVTDYGADPSGQKDSTIAVQKALEDAKAAGRGVTLNFPKGEYHFYKDFALKRKYHTSNTNSSEYPTKTIGILIEEQKELTLEGNGSLFIVHGNMMALAVVKSERVTLHGFSWDFATPTTTEMTVVATGKRGANTYADFYVPDNFHYEIVGKRNLLWTSEKSPYTGETYWSEQNQHNGYAVVGYNPVTQIVRRYSMGEGPLRHVKSIEKLGENTLRVTYRLGRVKPFEPGMVLEMCSSKYRETAGAFLWESSDTVVRDVNVHYMHGFGWLTQMCRNVTFENCNFTPREGTGRYCTSFADLIHVSGASGTINIENCNFSHAHDDAINIHGTFTRVKKRLNSHTLELEYVHKQQGGFPQYHVGDEVAFFSRDTLEQNTQKLYRVKSVTGPGEGGYRSKTMRVEFEEELPADIDATILREKKYVAENVTYTPKVNIKNCSFRSIPTRGILCTTRQPVLIEGNTFTNMSMATLFLSNDSNEWYESGPIRDMTIRDNVFTVRESNQKEWKYKSALYIHPVTKGGKLPSWETPIHKNILVENNTFYLQHDAVIKAESVENLTFRGNKVLRCDPQISLALRAENTALQSGGRTALSVSTAGTRNVGNVDALFDFTASKNIRLYGNTYDDGLQMTALARDMPAQTLNIQDPGITVNGGREASPAVSKLSYLSTNPTVASVSNTGVVTGLSKGCATIYAYYRWNGSAIPSNAVVVTVDGAPQTTDPFGSEQVQSSLSGVVSIQIPQLGFSTGTQVRESYVLQDTAALNSITLNVQADENTAGIALSRGEARTGVKSTEGKTLSVTLNLTTGINSFYIETTARDAKSKKITAVHIIHMGNTKADADALYLGDKPLEGFSPNVNEYTVVVPQEKAKGYPVRVKLGDEDQTASITINNVRREGTWFQADLQKGLNTVVVAVTAENMVDTSYYTLHLKVPDEGNTQLQNVQFEESSVELNQAFDPQRTSYTGASNTMRAKLRLEAVEPEAKIVLKAGKRTVTSQSNKLTHTLNFFAGTRTIQITVIAPNGNQRTYTMELESHSVATLTDVIFMGGCICMGVVTLSVILYRRKKALQGI